MMLRVIFFVPTLLQSAADGFPFEESKAGVRYQPPLSKPGPTPLRSKRDLQMTHWESRSHPNFDNEDSNWYGRHISYPSTLEDHSLLRTPKNFDVPGESTSTKLDVTEDILYDQDSKFNRCLIDVFRSQPIVSMLLFSGIIRNIKNPMNVQPETAKLVIPRCLRNRILGRIVQEPIFVEEPGWISIAVNGENLLSSEIHNREDPFYVARGKRSNTKTSKDDSNEERTKNPDTSVSTNYDKSQKSLRSTRKKRDIFYESSPKYLLESAASRLVSSRLMERSGENAYVQSRDKHSDILDILNEPFFISRGKKNPIGIQRSEYKDGYSAALINFEDKSHISNTWRPKETKKNCNPDTSNCSPVETKQASKSGSEPFRDRRGIMEELLNEADPFYLARGKRSSDVMREYNGTLDFPGKTTNKNLSSSVQPR